MTLKDIALIVCALCVFGGMLANGIFLTCLFVRAARKPSVPQASVTPMPLAQKVATRDQP